MPRTKELQDLLRIGVVWFGDNRNLSFYPTASESAGAQSVLAQPTILHQRSEKIVPFGVPEIDAELLGGGLACGVLHEWIAVSDLDSEEEGLWYPPLHILCSLIGRALEARRSFIGEPRFVVWIGERCWPSPSLLERVFSGRCHWRRDCIFVNPKLGREQFTKRHAVKFKRRSRGTATPFTQSFIGEVITHVVRSRAVLAAVFDGTGLDLSLSRRVQFAARKGETLVFAVRPGWEASRVSIAQTRWRIVPIPSESDSPKWRIELFRARGLRAPKIWEVVWDEREGENPALRLSAAVFGGTAETGASTQGEERRATEGNST